MQKTLFIALLTFIAVLPTSFAAEQSTKGTLVIGPSQHLAEATICLNGQPICYGLRKLEEDDEEEVMRGLEQGSDSGVLKPVNDTSGTPEVVCFGPFPQRCYGWYSRRLQDVLDEHRRLEATGDSELKDIECFNQQSRLRCN
ncbi:hypothetical protein PRIC1_006218 [Phytophthora ramorum]|uniref:RxLR effector protein n=1 Tax=Phytophthora ramorum TaxID=164328 RepID=H3GUH7_PHYRM|nr:hypothetical protein KRP23_14439 [Phytophthora ramorum]KAH7506319.1 hypothetical protein KRP22_4282 [Phytophthora ramorum]